MINNRTSNKLTADITPVPFRHITSGGRLTKWKGIVASFAPGTSEVVVTELSDPTEAKNNIPRNTVLPRTLAIAMLAAAPVLLSGTAAFAACIESAPGVWNCTGVETTTQNIIGADLAGDTTVNTDSTFAITTGSGRAIDIRNTGSDRDITFTDNDSANITGQREGLRITNQGTGATTVTTGTGVIRSNTREGIEVNHNGNGDLSITTGAGNIIAGGDGIDASHYGTSGDINIQVTGAISSQSNGIYAYDYNSSGSSANINITTSAAINAGNNGIQVSHYGAGYARVNTSGDIAAENIGVNVYGGEYSGDIMIDTSASAISARAGDLRYGIYVYNYGSGAIEITTGDITTAGSRAEGIHVTSDGSGGPITVDTTAGTIFGVDRGIHLEQGGDGAVSLYTADVTGGTEQGIEVQTYSGADVPSVTIDTTAGTVAGFEEGIYVDIGHTASGLVSISTADVTGGSNDDAIAVEVSDNAADIDVAINTATGTISGGQHGIYTEINGTGTVDISLAGDVSGGTGVGIYTASHVNQTVTIDVTGVGTVYSTSGGAILDLAGDATVTVVSNASVVGTIVLGDGSDNVTFAGADFSGVTLFDGGDDVAVADTFIDTLTFAGSSGALTGANVTNWENVIIGSGSTISFSDNILTAGILQTNAGGILNAAGGLSLTGNLTNNGIVTLQNGSVGDVAAVSGDYTGTGQLQVDVDFATDTADTLTVGGNVTGGTTSLSVADVSTGIATGNDVLVVDVTGATVPGDFTLAGGPISSGAFSYDLNLTGSQWFLGSVGVNGNGVIYESTPSILLGFTDLPTLEQRVGQRQWLSRDSARDPVQPDEGIWLRFFGDRINMSPKISTGASSYTSTNWGAQVGFDVKAEERDKGYWVFGVTGQYGTIDATALNNLGTGSIEANGYGLGATATWYGNNGTYFDAQGQINWIDSDISSSSNGSLVNGLSSTAYALGIEVGHRYYLDAQNALVPQAQLIWGKWNSDSFTDSAGNTVNLSSQESLIGRLGVAFEHEYTEGNFFGDHSPGVGYEGHREKVYVIGNLLHDFSSSRTVNVSGSNLVAQNEATWAEIGIGGSLVWDEDKTIYTEASYRTTISGSSGNNNGLSMTVGLRMSW